MMEMSEKVRAEFQRLLETEKLPGELEACWQRVQRGINVLSITNPKPELLVAVALHAGCFDKSKPKDRQKESETPAPVLSSDIVVPTEDQVPRE